MPSRDEILKAFDCINVWSRGLERAPHKPLLVLYALGQLTRGGKNLISFRNVAPKLTELLKEFGPTRKSYHPEYPFWRLQNDGVWIVDDADQLERRTGQTDIPKRELLNNNVHRQVDSRFLHSSQVASSATGPRSSRRTSCKNNLKQLGLALHNYHDTHGVFPASVYNQGVCATAYTPAGRANCRVMNTNGLLMLLPFLEQGNLYDQYNFNVAMSDNASGVYGTQQTCIGGGSTPTVMGDPLEAVF